ncbi:MAG: hypothetical protein IMZ65_00245 [Planctomycetes bacterium]|nr:hypothetical protein [Planctomycetota bacterium]
MATVIEACRKREAAEEAVSAREKEYGKKAGDNPRLRDKDAGAPAAGLTWAEYFLVNLADGTAVDGAWVPPDLAAPVNLPPDPLPKALGEVPTPPWLILAGQYFILGVIHDDAAKEPPRGRERLLKGFDLPATLRVYPGFAPCSGNNLPLDCFQEAAIQRALTDVASDLAALKAPTPFSALKAPTPLEALKAPTPLEALKAPTPLEALKAPTPATAARKIFAFSAAALGVLVFELCVHVIPWPWMRDHPNSLPVQLGGSAVIVCLCVAYFVPQWRNHCLVIAAPIALTILGLLGGSTSLSSP